MSARSATRGPTPLGQMYSMIGEKRALVDEALDLVQQRLALAPVQLTAPSVGTVSAIREPALP